MRYTGLTEQELERYLVRRAQEIQRAEEMDQEVFRNYGTDCCVVFTDLCNFSEYTAQYGILAFLQKMRVFEEIFRAQCVKAGGVVLKTEGDSMLILFDHVSLAVSAIRHTHVLLKRYNHTVETPHGIRLCAGVGCGMVLRIGNCEVYGDQVNKASKLGEDIAGAFDILLTEEAYQHSGMEGARRCLDEVTGITYYRFSDEEENSI